MKILGIETSGKTASVAITGDGLLLAQHTVYTAKTHSQVIMPMCMRLLEETGTRLDDIGLLAVAAGPGSYTGLRIGIAAVKAMSFVKGIPCAGVSVLEGLAAQLCTFDGLVVPVMSARAELLYSAYFRADGDSISRVTVDSLINADELAQKLSSCREKILLTGDAARDFGEKYAFRIAPETLRLQSAAGICLAARDKAAVTAEELEAAYLQITKAEKDLLEKENEG